MCITFLIFAVSVHDGWAVCFCVHSHTRVWSYLIFVWSEALLLSHVLFVWCCRRLQWRWQQRRRRYVFWSCPTVLDVRFCMRISWLSRRTCIHTIPIAYMCLSPFVCTCELDVFTYGMFSIVLFYHNAGRIAQTLPHSFWQQKDMKRRESFLLIK